MCEVLCNTREGLGAGLVQQVQHRGWRAQQCGMTEGWKERHATLGGRRQLHAGGC